MAAIAVEAKPLLAAEAKKNQKEAGAANLARYNGNPSSSVKTDKSSKPIDARREVASQFDVSQGYVYAAQKISAASPAMSGKLSNTRAVIDDCRGSARQVKMPSVMCSTDLFHA